MRTEFKSFAIYVYLMTRGKGFLGVIMIAQQRDSRHDSRLTRLMFLFRSHWCIVSIFVVNYSRVVSSFARTKTKKNNVFEFDSCAPIIHHILCDKKNL